MTTREFIPAYGPDRESLEAGMQWLMNSNDDQELFLYLSLKSHLDEGKLIHTLCGANFCKKLKKEEKISVNGKIINLLTDRSYTTVPRNSRILAVHVSDKALESIEKKHNFENLLVVAWNCFFDLPGWIQKHGATQFQQFRPIDPTKLPGWHSSEQPPENNFVFSEDNESQ